MFQSLKMNKTLTAALLLTASMAFSLQSIAKDKFSTDIENRDDCSILVTQEDVKKNKGLWGKALKELKNARLSLRINAPTIELGKIGVQAGYKETSDISVGNKYSGIDSWTIGVGADSRWFWFQKMFGINASLRKEITYIQQFNCRRQSIFRVPYDPFTKTPNDYAHFQKRYDNNTPFFKDGEYLFKVGDFMSYKIPMMVGASANLLSELVDKLHLNLDAGYQYYLAGEFDIQIFRMDEDHIRLRVLAINSDTRGVYAKVHLFGLDGAARLVVDHILDDKVLEAEWRTKIDSDLYMGDYILKLSSPEAETLYNNIIASKMQTFNVNLLTQFLGSSKDLDNRQEFNKKLFSDLSAFNTLAAKEAGKPTLERAAIKIINAENHSHNVRTGWKLGLKNLFKWDKSGNKIDASIGVLADNADKDFYILHSSGAHNEYKGVANRKKGERKQLNALFAAEKIDPNAENPESIENMRKTKFEGLHYAKTQFHHDMSNKEYMEYYEKIGAHLPEEMKNILVFPHLTSGVREEYENAYLNMDIYFTNKIFDLNPNLHPVTIARRLVDLLNKIPALDGSLDPKKVNQITETLALAFNTSSTSDQRYDLLSKLMATNVYFEKYGMTILLNIINANTLKDCVRAKLSYSGTDFGDAKVLTYPSEDIFTSVNLFRNIIEQNNYIQDRSYNLRIYLKEDGSPYSVEELLLKNEKLNRRANSQ